MLQKRHDQQGEVDELPLILCGVPTQQDVIRPAYIKIKGVLATLNFDNMAQLPPCVNLLCFRSP